MDIDMKPMYEHDCDTCIFLGHVVINKRNADIYVCEDKDRPEWSTLVYRHSDEPSDYGSIMANIVSPLSIFASVALAMYVRHLDANSASGFFKGTFSKDSKIVLKIL